jgi:hypothetical protein
MSSIERSEYSKLMQKVYGSWYLFSDSESAKADKSPGPVRLVLWRAGHFRMLEPGEPSPLRCSPRFRFRLR